MTRRAKRYNARRLRDAANELEIAITLLADARPMMPKMVIGPGLMGLKALKGEWAAAGSVDTNLS